MMEWKNQIYEYNNYWGLLQLNKITDNLYIIFKSYFLRKDKEL